MTSLARPGPALILSAIVALSISCGDEATEPLPASHAEQTAMPAAGELNSAEALPFQASFGGVGIGFAVIDGAVEVRHVVEGMSADVAGIEVGDLIVSVDGISTDGLSPDDFLELGRGAPGTTVRYELLDDAGGTTVLTLERVRMDESRRAHRRVIRHQREFGGLGMVVTERDGVLHIREVLAGLPAELAGVQAGDQLLAVDGHATEGQLLIDVIGLVRGEVGTSVTIDVASATGTTRELEIERTAIVLPERHHGRRACGH